MEIYTNLEEIKEIKPNTLINADCLEAMKYIPDKSIDLILCDLPYGTTACKWDIIIPFQELWKQYNRVIKDNGAIVLFGSEPFSTYLRMSNIKNYKYDWIWDKNNCSNYVLAKKRPLQTTETISVFNTTIYYPQNIIPYGKIKSRGSTAKHFGEDSQLKDKNLQDFTNYPKNILYYPKNLSDKSLHPTQKPIELLEYLIKTYTNEGELVLDNCMGSGSTGVACISSNRKFIGIELNNDYFNIAKERIKNTIPNTSQNLTQFKNKKLF